MKNLTQKQIEAIKAVLESNALWLDADDIAPILQKDPQTIRTQARADRSMLGFEASITGNTVQFPRIKFIEFWRLEECVNQ